LGREASRAPRLAAPELADALQPSEDLGLEAGVVEIGGQLVEHGQHRGARLQAVALALAELLERVEPAPQLLRERDEAILVELDEARAGPRLEQLAKAQHLTLVELEPRVDAEP